MYTVYILECADRTFYTGYTNDIEKRLRAHNTSKNGAKYTRARRPVRLVYAEKFSTLSRAMKREAAIKRLTREEKLELLSTASFSVRSFSEGHRDPESDQSSLVPQTRKHGSRG